MVNPLLVSGLGLGLGARDATQVDTAAAASTIAPFHSKLDGVNQPLNMLFVETMWWTLGGFGLLLLVIRLCQIGYSELRRMSASPLPGNKMQYWRSVQFSWMPTLKRDLLYAPLWKKRHNREFQLSAAGNMGTLPSRLHTVVLGVWIASNIIYMFILDWTKENGFSFAAEIRGRSGTLSLVNMVPLIIFAGRNNPLIPLLRISFDTYNLFHRSMGRLSAAEAVIHTMAWAYVQFADGGWDAVMNKILGKMFEGSGMLATISMLLMVILSLSPIRHAFYETFLNSHIALALITFIGVLIHCITPHVAGGLPQLPWMVGILTMWFLDRLARVFRIAYVNWSLKKGFTTAVCEPMPGECTRVTMILPRYVDIKAGSHCYLRFAGVSPLESHPFSVAWVDHVPHKRNELPLVEDEKQPIVALDRDNTATSVSFLIGARTGFTRRLFDTATAAGVSGATMRAAVEGPYAGHHSLDSYGHVVLFAGATGITHQISYLKPLIEAYNEGTTAVRRITLVWTIRDYESLEWIRLWINTVLRMPNRRDILRIQVFVTRPRNPREIISPSTTVQMFPGRPNVSTLLRREVEDQQGAMCVTVCGPGALADDVRQAVRERQADQRVIDFVEESFTW